MKKLFLFVISCITLVSCERYKDADIVIPFESKLVSVSFIEEGSNEIQLGLTRTTPVFNTTYLEGPVIIKDAAVRLTTPNAFYELQYDEIENLYKTTMQDEFFEEGKIYSISVDYNGETITGTGKIPSLLTPIINIRLDSIPEADGHSYIADITCSIKEPGIHNISLGALMVYSDSSVIPMQSTAMFPAPIARIKQGQSFSSAFKSIFASPFASPVRIDVFVMLCDDAYTKYNNSAKGIDWTGGGLQLGEPVIGYGNMSNGIGAMGAYRYLPIVQVPVK